MKDAHSASINYLTTLNLSGADGTTEIYFATMCLSGTLKLWQNSTEHADSEFKQSGELLFGKNLQEAFQLTAVGQKYLLLVVGGYDKNVHCYTCLRNAHQKAESPQLFTYKFSLTGHMNSLKDFSFTAPKYEFDNEIQYLASCS